MTTETPVVPAGRSSPTVLVVDDDPLTLELTAEWIRVAGGDPAIASTVAAAWDLVTGLAGRIRLVITDVRLPDGNGVDLFRRIHQEWPALPAILVTGYGSTDDAVVAMREGAFYYFTKPVDSTLFVRVVREALDKQQLVAHMEALEARLASSARSRLIGSSRAMEAAIQQAAAVAELDVTVLLAGETGTGKELFAHYIHDASRRRRHPFVAVNCAAVPEALLESELFGHERGAFTGAVARKPGRFELAAGGTLLLDEIGDLALPLQGKLLRVIETKQLDPLGSARSRTLDVRLIASTNHDLAALVQREAFRQDLYYRLDVFPIVLPPLRARREDVPLLAAHFIAECRASVQKELDGFDETAIQALSAYSWPGNVRELRHIVERAAITTRSPVIGVGELPARVLKGDSSARPPAEARPPSLDELERAAIRAALEETGGNRTRAAQKLGISRNQIRYRLRKHQLL
ncbi:MAG: sigma-54 dependent transcriptional regulator [Acidobacteriota bacterium]